MTNLLKRIGGALKDAVFQMFGLQAVFGPGTGEDKKAAIMDFLKNAIGIGELALGKDIVDEAEFVAGLDQAVLRTLVRQLLSGTETILVQESTNCSRT
jgi:hypothetical protein